MEDISKGSNTLTKNAISKFIVRFDWMATPDINIVDIVNQLSKLNNFDLLLDIDSIDDTQESIGNWEQVLKNLNHAAYHKFVEFMLPKYLETLK